MNDFDIWQDAIDKMDLTEAVAPTVRGVTLLEDTQVEMYNKIQKLLNTDGMESSHMFLYQLDPLELSEAECDKVNKLYALGQERGLIVDEPEAPAEEPADVEDVVEPEEKLLPVAPPVIPIQRSAFTVLYSATRNGEIKSGEAFSNCIDVRSAKADVIAKLDRAGYQNIQILAIEAGDPDMAGCEEAPANDNDEVPDYSVEEADDREPLSHALDPVRVKASSASLAGQDAVSVSEVVPSKKQQDIVSEKDNKEDAPSNEEADDSDSENDAADEKPEDKDNAEDANDKKDNEEKDADADDEADAEDADTDELTAEQKEELKNSYTKAFKDAMKKCKFSTSFSELSLDQKVQFFTELSKAWGDKADPSKFMTDKETDQLEKIVIKA